MTTDITAIRARLAEMRVMYVRSTTSLTEEESIQLLAIAEAALDVLDAVYQRRLAPRGWIPKAPVAALRKALEGLVIK